MPMVTLTLAMLAAFIAVAHMLYITAGLSYRWLEAGLNYRTGDLLLPQSRSVAGQTTVPTFATPSIVLTKSDA